MDALELIARFVLAAVFVVAGLTKLADRHGSREALVAFGVPERLAAPGAVALPVAELAVAVLLTPAATAVAGTIGALALLLGFCAGIARSMIRGESPDCHCFGQLHSEPVGWPTLIRNLLLAAAAGIVLAAGLDGSSAAPFAWIGNLSGTAVAAIAAGFVVLALLAAAVAFAVSMLRQNGRLLLRVDALEEALRGHGVPVGAAAAPPPPQFDGLALGSQAPDFTLPGVHGETITLEALLAAEKPVMLVFTDPGCGPCTALLPQVATWQREHEGELTIALISRGSAKDNRAKAAEHGAARMFVEDGTEVSSLYKAEATPSAVIVNADGTIGSPLTGGEPAIRSLVVATLATVGIQVVPGGAGNGAAAPAGIAIGDEAPEIELVELSGETVALSSFRGEDTLVLFWNPTCGFCSQMLEDLRAFERRTPDGAPRLLVISSGSTAANQAMGLSSRVVLDQSFAAGNAFAAPGTPSAVLLGEGGRVASAVAAGADACFELARRPVQA
jgi:peroxiredoxin